MADGPGAQDEQLPHTNHASSAGLGPAQLYPGSPAPMAQVPSSVGFPRPSPAGGTEVRW